MPRGPATAMLSLPGLGSLSVRPLASVPTLKLFPGFPHRCPGRLWRLLRLSHARAGAELERARERDREGTGRRGERAAHVPVLLREVLECFQGRHLRTFIDGTLGAGGHTCAVLREHPEVERVVAVDVDPTAHKLAKDTLSTSFADRLAFRAEGVEDSPASLAPAGSRTVVHLVRGNFRQLDSLAAAAGIQLGTVDAILLDIGVSSMQVDLASRGFSFLQDGPLDMRMDPHSFLTAEELVNEWPEAELGRVIREYGEERAWRAMARRIVEARRVCRIRTTAHLCSVLTGQRERAPGARRPWRPGPSGRIHPATRAFQALRIAVNGELESLAQTLPKAAALLAPGGRLAVITFHSLEDRIVKHSFLEAAGIVSDVDVGLGTQRGSFRGAFHVVTRKPISASEQEVNLNSRSRSAKLRVLEKFASH